jgi:hypothetical protein
MMLTQLQIQSPLANMRNVSTLRAAKRDNTAQQAVNAIVRTGCSVESMQSLLKQAGFSSEDVATLVGEAYPSVSE